MQLPSFDDFSALAREKGFDEVLERRWSPGQIVPTHSHPFAAHAIVVQGEMWLQVDGSSRHLCPGDRFELEPNVPHDERYGAEGATYWVARRAG